MKEKFCLYSKCRKLLVPGADEKPRYFNKRTTCGRPCANAYTSEVKALRKKPVVVKVEKAPEVPPVPVPFLREQLAPPPGYSMRMMRGALV